MIDVAKFCASVEECLGWPYVSPGNNDSRGIDCSGLFVKAFRDQGEKIYHGSNTIYRKYCSERGKLTKLSQLRVGMAVFKWNPNTPEKFNDNLGDFQHIGAVVSVNPLRIIHASTGTMCVTTDTKLGNWKYWGWLKAMGQLQDMTANDEEVIPMTTDVKQARVTAPSGSTVNLRKAAQAGSALLTRVPIGTVVDVLDDAGSWTKVNYKGMIGYVMTVFLAPVVDESQEPRTLEERVTRLEERVTALEAGGGGLG